MRRIAAWMLEALRHAEDAEGLEALRSEVEAFCAGYPVPGI
jgi:glycine/serine hydroxymethyltransferase